LCEVVAYARWSLVRGGRLHARRNNSHFYRYGEITDTEPGAIIGFF